MKGPKSCQLELIADKETTIIDPFLVCGLDYYESDFQFFTQVNEDDEDIDDDEELSEAISKLGRVVEIHKNKKLKLIFKSALKGPELSLLSRDNDEPMSQREFDGLLKHVDGWLIMSVSGCGQRLCFSIVRKKSWIAAGRPMVIDVSLDDRNSKKKQAKAKA